MIKKILLLLLLLSTNILALEKVSLALEWKYQFQFAGYIAAKEKGFYKEAGFDVGLMEYNGKDTVDMILNKETTFATSKSKVILEKMQGKNLVLIASFFKKSALVFVTQEDIRTPEQFINKSIMSAQSELVYSNLAILLNKFNITFNDFEHKQQTYNIDDFINKKVDIMSAFVSNELYHLDKMQYKYNIIDPANYGIYTYNENLITSLEYARLNPKKTRAFKEATIKGWKYALEHKRELIDIIYEKYSQAKSKKALLYEAYKTEQLIMPHIFDVGYIDEIMIDNTAHSFVEMGLHGKYYDLDNFIFDKKNNKVKNSTLKLTKEEKNYLQNKTIKMCIDPDWMPFESFNDKKHIGMSADYFKLLKDILNTEISVVQSATWQESLQLGKDRKCDIFSLVAATNSRREFLNFTKPYFKFPFVVATQNDKRFISDLDSVMDKKFTIVKDYAFIEILKNKYKNIDLIEVNNINDGLSLVHEGKAFGHIDVLYTVAYAIEKTYYSSLKINGHFNEKWDLAIGVRNDEPLLLSILNKASSLITEQQKQHILNSWLSVKYEKSFDYTMFYQVIFVFSILLLFIVFRYMIISKEHKKLKALQDELSHLNSSLQIKIDEEILKSLRKDKYLQEQTKLAAMGEMVGAIAHQWRQPLNSLNINIQNLDDDYEDGLVNKKFIDKFIDHQTTTIRFMSKTIDDFRNFFRIDKIKNDFSIKDAIQSTINIQSSQLSTHNIYIYITGDDFIFNGLKSEFQQVILNLITNAKDELIKKDIKNPIIKISVSQKMIKVLDNAGGIPDEIINRIFEPYFTTKEQGQGTGMGLYMSKMIIETNMDGEFSAQNTDEGAEFVIKLK